MEISAHGTIRHRASASERLAGLLRQTLVDLAKALSLRSQGNFANFICRVYTAKIRLYLLQKYYDISQLEAKFQSKFMYRAGNLKFFLFFTMRILFLLPIRFEKLNSETENFSVNNTT